jgi:hypothetical protein
MGDNKPPQLVMGEDKAMSVQIWRKKFNSWCVLKEWRDPAKEEADPEHYIEAKRVNEIAAFHLALPDDLLTMFEISIAPKMSAGEKKHPWWYVQHLQEHFEGQDNIMPHRLDFFNCTQKANESITDYELRIRAIAGKTRFEEMTSPKDELMRDRLCTGVQNNDLRQLLLQHFKEDGKTPLSFADQLKKAKAWEAAHKTNAMIEQGSTTKEQVNFTQRQTPGNSQPTKCGWCGGPRHSRRECPASKPGNVCKNCNMKENHLTKMCRSRNKRAEEPRRQKSKPPHRVNAADAAISDDDDEYVAHSFQVYASSNVTGDKFLTWLPVVVEENRTVKILVQVDSAASCNTMPSSLYEKLKCPTPLKRSRATITPYAANTIIHPLGKQTFLCEGTAQFETLDFQVIKSSDIPGKPALLSGRDSLKLGLLKMHPKVFASTSTDVVGPPSRTSDLTHQTDVLKPGNVTLSDIKSAFRENFKGLGKIGKPVHLEMNPDVTPCHAGYHRIPVSKLETVKAKLDEMVACGKLEKIEKPTDWCSNMLVREKQRSDGSTKIRLCLDPSQTINKAIMIPRYQIPTTSELLPQLSGKKYKTFSIFDALDGFTQIELDEQSRDLTTMHTPWGRYRWCRLPYGVSSAPEEFQRRMHELLDGLPGVFSIADDVLVVGQGDTRDEANREHDQHLIALMHRSAEHNLKWNPNKVQFKLPKITFMGNIYSEDGITPDPSKVAAILDMPNPQDKASVSRYCGMINYLSQFCPNLSQIIKPLYDLTKSDREFLWAPVHEKAFQKSKHVVAKSPCLAYFDHRKPVVLQCDASQGGLGGALLQPNEQGNLQPVAFTSCRMRPNEENWAQIEKECLAIVSACDKWDLWLYGLDLEVHTDHQPLETIFKKPLQAAPRRLQKMMMRLQRYRLRIKYKKGSSLTLADTLSRAPQNTTNDSKQTNFEIFRVNIDTISANKEESNLKTETLADHNMRCLMETVQQGWPNHKSEVPETLWPYWSYRDELSVCDGIIYKGQQIVIPPSMRKNILEKIHVAHMGPESNIRLCRDVVFWPGMRSDVREMCHNCGKCAQYSSQNAKENMLSQPIPIRPWQFVSQDIAVFESGNYLVTVDHYSDFIELDELPDTLANTIARKTEAHIARYGAFDVLLTDNGPQFIASEFEGLCNRYSIQHVTSSPYWPQGNGKAESAVKAIKLMMKKSGVSNINEALLIHRNTPPPGHDFSPAQRCMGRRTRIPMPMSHAHLSPFLVDHSSVPAAIVTKRHGAMVQYNKHANLSHTPLQVGDFAYAKPPPHRKSGPWDYGIITETPSPRSYILETPRGVIRRNRAHVRPAAPPPADSQRPPRRLASIPLDRATVDPLPTKEHLLPQPVSTTPLQTPPVSPPHAATPAPLPPTGGLGTPAKVTPVSVSPCATPWSRETVTRCGRVSRAPIKLDL